MQVLIHISFGGPVRHLAIGTKTYRFEDHQYCGPVVLGKNDMPLDKQPSELDTFWTHVNAWYAQGKKTKFVGDQAWCVYQTQMQEARKLHAKAREQAKGAGHG